jgi:hypothetical protein
MPKCPQLLVKESTVTMVDAGVIVVGVHINTIHFVRAHQHPRSLMAFEGGVPLFISAAYAVMCKRCHVCCTVVQAATNHTSHGAGWMLAHTRVTASMLHTEPACVCFGGAACMPAHTLVNAPMLETETS